MIRCLSTVLGRVRDLPVSLLWRARAERDQAIKEAVRQAMFRNAAEERALRSHRKCCELSVELERCRQDFGDLVGSWPVKEQEQ